MPYTLSLEMRTFWLFMVSIVGRACKFFCSLTAVFCNLATYCSEARAAIAAIEIIGLFSLTKTKQRFSECRAHSSRLQVRRHFKVPAVFEYELSAGLESC